MKVRLNVKSLKDISSGRHTNPIRNRWIARMGLGLLIATASLSYYEAQMYLRADAWRAHSDAVISQIMNAEISIKTAEASMRGFLLMPREEFAAELEIAEHDAEAKLDSLRKLVADNPSKMNC